MMPAGLTTSNHRINIIGASGTGKTTLGNALAARLGIPAFDSDDYYHLPSDPPYQQQRSAEDCLRLAVEDLGRHRAWVLTGFVRSWDAHPVFDFSLVVFLYLPADIRLARLREREARRFGARIQPGGDLEETHRAFMAWTAAYDSGMTQGSDLAAHRAHLQALRCPSIVLDAPVSTEEQVERIMAHAGMTGR